jgi:transcriptional regulator GlxA family with amidase domain
MGDHVALSSMKSGLIAHFKTTPVHLAEDSPRPYHPKEGEGQRLPETARKYAQIQILDYPGAQQSAVLGIRDLMDFAAKLTELSGATAHRAEICYTPKEGAVAVILPPALSLAPPVLPAGWKERLIRLHQGGTVLASVCSGAFLLAETGLVDRRQVTTHWRHAAAFRERFPHVVTDIDRLLVDLGDVVTAGGVMAWTDLTLHMIERFGGRKLMLDVAKMFVVDPPEREQSHYASFLPNFKHADASILTVQHMLQENISATYTLAGLAQAATMSERSFLRRFKKATGLSPVAYIQSLRVEAARSRLELTKVSFERLSWDLGYNDSATFRSVFKRITGLSPSDYRRKFGAGGPASQL